MIICFSRLFRGVRILIDRISGRVRNKFIRCPMCMGFWVGVFMSLGYGYRGFNVVGYGFMGSVVSYTWWLLMKDLIDKHDG